MTEKYTYYLYISSVWTKKTIYNNQLDLIYKIDEKYNGVALKELEGSFILINDDFDEIIGLIPNPIQMRIYENGDILTGTLIWEGYINQYNDYDYAKKSVLIKDFTTNDTVHSFILNMDKRIEKYVNQGTAYDINSDAHGLITENSYKLENVLNEFTLTTPFDETDAWYDSEPFDFSYLRFAMLDDLNNYNGTGGPKRITLERIFQILESIFKIYWYFDGSDLKFKTASELVNNTIDLSDSLTHRKIKRYEFSKKYKLERLRFHKNHNYSGAGFPSGYDEEVNCIEYTHSADKNMDHDLTDIMTLYNPTEFEWDVNGWFLAFVDPADDYLEIYNTAENGKLKLSNIINDYYRNYLFTNNTNYKYNNTAETVAPTNFREFIQLEEIETILDSILTFNEGIIYQSDSIQITGRTVEQRTNLFTNITRFMCYEYKNENLS
jgi:hypothetical protein